MTEQPGAPTAPYDLANQHLASGPATIVTSRMPTPMGLMLVLTIRTSSTTVTVLLSRDDAMNWGHAIRQEAGRISPLVTPGGSGALIVPNGHGPT